MCCRRRKDLTRAHPVGHDLEVHSPRCTRDNEERRRVPSVRSFVRSPTSRNLRWTDLFLPSFLSFINCHRPSTRSQNTVLSPKIIIGNLPTTPSFRSTRARTRTELVCIVSDYILSLSLFSACLPFVDFKKSRLGGTRGDPLLPHIHSLIHPLSSTLPLTPKYHLLKSYSWRNPNPTHTSESLTSESLESLELVCSIADYIPLSFSFPERLTIRRSFLEVRNSPLTSP